MFDFGILYIIDRHETWVAVIFENGTWVHFYLDFNGYWIR